MKRLRLIHLCVTCYATLVLLSGCSASRLVVDHIADALAEQADAPEDDLLLARDAGAFYLKLSESMLRRAPEHMGLAEAVAAGFTRYAYAFIAFEAERVESKDARLAAQLRERAVRMYRRANGHAMRALELHYPSLRAKLTDSAQTRGLTLRAEHIGLAYWASASWAASISLSTSSAQAIADLPLAIRLADLAWERQPDFGQGSLASLMGSLEAARPGGTKSSAERFFDQASAAGGGANAAVFVARAETLAAPAGDRQAFEGLLKQAIATAERHRSPDNGLMLERAKWLLGTVEDRF